MVTCAVCKQEKPESEFSPGLLKRTPGHRRCRPCQNALTKAYHAANPDKRKQYDKTYEQRCAVIRRAETMLKGAVRRGRIVVGPCAVCGTTENIHGHHFSYEPKDWLSVIWLCPLHHKQVHAGEMDDKALTVTHGVFPDQMRQGSWPEETRLTVKAQRISQQLA